MKPIINAVLFCSLFLLAVNCGRHRNTNSETISADTLTVPDTGYTGIKQYFAGQNLIYEATLKNGVRHGLMKSFYSGGQVRVTYWYENGLREDSAKWYYQEGQIFRATPYKNDTIHGTQVQYFRNGRKKAKLGFEKGLRNFFFEEYMANGKLITNYPDVIVNTKDNYSTNGTYEISLKLSDPSTDVQYFYGDFSKNVFDTAAVAPIKTVKGAGNLTLKKSSSPTKPNVEIVASILTKYGNRYLVLKDIELPYNDLQAVK